MARFIYVDANLYDTAARLLAEGDRTPITASRLAARALNAPHQSLTHGATETLKQADWAIASTLKAQAIFRRVLQDTLQPADLLGTANAWLLTGRSLPQPPSHIQMCRTPAF